MKTIRFLVLASVLLGIALGQELGKYYINKQDIHVSGISAGAYMAVQLGVAYSTTFRGVGSIAGGPYYCAEGDVVKALTNCMSSPNLINVNSLVKKAQDYSARGDIDDLSNLKNQKVYIYAGKSDKTVNPAASQKLEQFYETFTNVSNLLVEYSINSGHAHITDDYGNACGTSNLPYINNCGYDQSGIILKHVSLKSLQPRGSMINSNLLEFDQSSFRGTSLQKTGFVYVPTACQKGQASGGCSLHVALHGCQMNSDSVQIRKQYVENSGYNEWAETNNIIILYPQCATSVFPSNPNACFDWWGYADSDYATKDGSQMKAIKSMIDRLISGAPTLAAPSGLLASGISDNHVTLSWNAVPQAIGYRLYRNGATVNPSIIYALVHTDTGLSTGTTYQYSVAAIGTNEIVGETSSPISVTTTGPPPPLGSTSITVKSTTSDTVSLEWIALSGAYGYVITRDRSIVVGNVTTNTFTDRGLTEQTTYVYSVKGFTNSGEYGPDSPEVQATTSSSWVCQEYYDNNYNHVSKGHAYQKLGYVYALGSDEYMGLYNIAAYNRLANTAPDYYVIGNC